MESIELVAADGYRLGATVYAAGARERGVVVLGGATAVPQGFYRRFCEFLAGRGLTALTFDYRGIGRSRRGPLRGLEASYTHWCGVDSAAAYGWALARGPTTVVGHSLGGHAFGWQARANETLGLLAFGTGAGWHGHMPRAERVRVRLLWEVAGPVTTRLLGYLPMRALGLGEDLPLGVYRQWRHWCRFPRYFFDDPASGAAEAFARVRVPVVGVNATDDLWAPPRSAGAFFSGYTAARPLRLEAVEPRALGLGPVGHMGYVRPAARPLWERAARFVEERLAETGAAAAARG